MRRTGGRSGSRFRAWGCLLAATGVTLSSILVSTSADAAPPVGLTFAVTTTADSADTNPGDGQCRDFSGACSLRAAVLESNARAGLDTIVVPAAVHEIETPTINEDLPETGDLDLHDSVVIRGAGAASVVDGGVPGSGAPADQPGLDRLFEIHPGAQTVEFVDLTLREGYSSAGGGAVQNWSAGLVRFQNVDLLANLAEGAGGAINNGDAMDYEWPVPDPSHEFLPGGRIEIVDSRLSNNGAGGGGAAIYNTSKGSVTLERSEVTDNPGDMIVNPQDPSEMIPAPGVYEPESSAITNAGERQGVGNVRIIESDVSGNWSNGNGAGIANDGDGTILVEESTVADNTSLADGGGIFTHGGTVTVRNSTVEGNKAANGGGISSDGASTSIGLRAKLVVATSQIKDNTADASGGGVDSGGDAHVSLADTTVSGNHAGDAGGGLNHGGRASLDLTRTTFSGNETHDEGGGAYIGSERLTQILSSTFTDNHAGTPEPPEPGSGPTDPSSANIAGGGALYTENGALELRASTFTDNTSTDEGGALSIDNFGDVKLIGSTFRGNKAGTDGGAIENSGARVLFDELMITENRAALDGGGIYNSSSGEFTIVGTTVKQNSGVSGGGLANAPDNKMHIKSSLFLRNTARTPPLDDAGVRMEGGHGGGIWSMADGDTLIENTTVSSNVAATGGGGIFHDADGEIKLSNVTVWRNKAPLGGGIGVVESDFVPEAPPKPNVSVILRNTIVGGSLEGKSCDYFLTSEGGNLATDYGCFISSPESEDPEGIRDRIGLGKLDAIADNGGPTLTHMPQRDSLAVDGGVNPCPELDQRGVKRPQNGRCDSGAVEYQGAPPDADDVEPETEYLTGPIQDSLETVAFTFTGSDDQTATEELQYECRLLEIELTEEPEPPAPWDPVDPELMWRQCTSPWSVPLIEEGLFEFQVRAIDRAGNVDSTPDIHHINGSDENPPDTRFTDTPPHPSTSRSATFTFVGLQNEISSPYMEFECRLDSSDPEMWLECFNPAIYGNLTTGWHKLEVRAVNGQELTDPTPATYRWEVGPGLNPDGTANCDSGNVTLTPLADAWVDEVSPSENFLFHTDLQVRSGTTGDPGAVPPEPGVGENARALFKFDIPNDAPDCDLESAKLRLHADGSAEGRTLEALPLDGAFRESTVTWMNQPGVATETGPTAGAGIGYRDFDVTTQVLAMMRGGVANHGWSIRDTEENDPEGGEWTFHSRETFQDPPEQTLPLLVLKYEENSVPPPAAPTMDPGTQPRDVRCGEVITTDTIVGNDISCDVGEGLVIGAPNIILDLGGHTIDGPDYLLGNVSGQEEGMPAAIRNSGHSNVIIRNGTVQQMGYGVLLTSGTTHNLVTGLTVRNNAMSGVELFDADDGRSGNTVRSNTITDNELGVSLLAGNTGALITGNVIGGNLGEQILVQFSDENRIENNTVHGIPSDPQFDSDGGVLFEGSSDNIISGGQIRDTGDAGIVINQGANGNTVEDVEMFRNGDAGVIIIDSDRTRVSGITAHQESDGGVVVNNGHETEIRNSHLEYNPSGVEASNSNDLIVVGNDASYSLQSGFELGNGVNMVVRDNIANHTGGAGISMEGGAFDAGGLPVGGALIEGNTTNENAESGISVADGGHTVEDNDAHNNAGFGITIGENPEVLGDPFTHTNIAPPLSNRASGNGEVTQCSGLICDEGGTVPLTDPDVEPPNAVLLSGPTAIRPAFPGATASTSATFTFTGTDNRTPETGMVFECRLDPPPDPLPEVEEPPTEPEDPGTPPEVPEPVDGVGWGECASPMSYHGLEQGSHHFEVRVLDQADLRDLSPAVHDWTVDITEEEEGAGPDTVPPDTRIASGPSGSTTIDTASFAFAGTDNSTPGSNLAYECKLDGAAWAPCLSPALHTGLAPGQHTFSVRAIDRASPTPNVDPSPATRTWTVVPRPQDTTPPDTTLLSGPDPTTTLRTATFTFTSDDPTASFECRLGTAAFAPCSSPQQYTATDLPVGLHEFNVRAKDVAGNVDPTPAGQAWSVGAAPVPGFVSCGQVVTRSILVRNDLIDCLWDGLRIGADNITIDLDGHTIDGKGIAAAIRNDGFDNVTIKNGKVTDYDYGVMLNPGTQRNIVENLDITANQEAGIALGQVPHPTDPSLPYPSPAPSSFQSNVVGNILRNNTLTANGMGVWLTNRTLETSVLGNQLHANQKEGIWIDRSANSKVENNEISGSSSAGVVLEGSGGNLVLNNLISENGGGVSIGLTTSGTPGLPSNDNRVEKNTITESGGHGIEVIGSYRNTLLDNVSTHSNGDGIELYQAQETTIKGNDLRNNKGGLSLISSSHNRIEGNDASESEGTGISLEALSTANVLLNNTSSNNDGDGLYVGDETSGASGMWIEGNRTNNNKGYGIFVPKVSHTIKANIANDNGGWGIYASEGSNGRTNLDAGGNKAQGNVGPLDPITLKPLQCFSVRCDGAAPPKTDHLAPDTQLLEGPAASSTTALQTFRFTGSDSAGPVTFSCSLDGESAWIACESPFSISRDALAAATGSDTGDHTLIIRAVDSSGNVDLTPIVHEWFVDTLVEVPAEVAIDSAPDPVTVSRDARFLFTATQDATVECALDGAAFAACSSPKDYLNLSVGQHTFEVRALSGAGEGTDRHSWTIKTAPVAASIACGDVINRSIRVTNDLVDCAGNGIIVGAHGITIDLDGHTIDGTGLDAGILNNGFDDVTITNGFVHEFDYGVLLNPGSGGNVVDRMHAELNQIAGIGLADADRLLSDGIYSGTTVRESTLIGNSVGIALHSGTRSAVIRDNALGANTAEGILIESSVGALVHDNEIATSGGPGIATLAGSLHRIEDNDLRDNGSGIVIGEELLGTPNTVVSHNKIVAGSGGILVNDSVGTQILENVLRDTLGAGIELSLSSSSIIRGNDLASNAGGISLEESSGNRIEANIASGTLGTGIEIGSLSFDNDVLHNTASDNGGEGIEVTDAPPAGRENRVEDNTADSNGGDGIVLSAVGNVVENNSASLNGGWGIYAAVGAIDRGGNFAAGNMEPEQCYRVTCTQGEVPGAPDTWIVEKPPPVSHSRNASFTYNGEDDVNALHELTWECRLDSTDPLAWEDCEYPAEFLNLSPGTHTFEVRAVDLELRADSTPARYTWRYEPLPSGVAPEAVIDIKPPATTWLPDAIFTFHSNEPDVTFECKVDTFPYEACGFETAAYMSQGAFEWGLAETEVGPHTFSVRAIDAEGNVGVPATHTWSLLGVVSQFTSGPGFTPGETPLEPATGGPTTSRTATIAFSANVADSTFECSLDLEPFAPCTSPVTYNSLANGEHLLRVVATTPDGLTQVEVSEYEWEVVADDNVPPETSLERAPANNSSATVFEFTGIDDMTYGPHLLFECRLDSTSNLDWQACTSPVNLLDLYTYEDPQLAPGQHTFEVRAIDAADPLVPDPNNPEFEGNVDPTPASYTWTMAADTTPPGTGITAGLPAKIGPQTEALVEFFGTDTATPTPALVFECSLDGAPFEPCSSPESVSGLEPGTHELRIRARDLAGNYDPTPAVETWTVVPAPVTSITSGPAGRVVEGGGFVPPSSSENAVFVFGADQPGSTFECSLDGADFTRCTSPKAFWVVANGEHTFAVRATNPEGVVEEPPAEYTWNVELGPDLTRPNTTILSTPPVIDSNSVATFTFAGSDNRTPAANLSFECALDGSAYNSCTSPDQWSDLVRGSHTLLVRAKDAAGNFDATPASYTWSVEGPPVTTILTGPADPTEERTATFTFVSDTPGSTFRCWFRGVETACSSPHTISGLSAGQHAFYVHAIAPGGTLEQQWVEHEWVVGELDAPLTIIDSTPGVEHENNVPAEFAFHSTADGVSFQCSLNGAEPTPCLSPKRYPRLPVGEYSFAVEAVYPPMYDPEGQLIEPLYEPVVSTYDFTVVDTVAPDTTIRFAPPATTGSPLAYFGFGSSEPGVTFECSLDLGGFSECEQPYVVEDLTQGQHSLQVRAVDAGQLADPTPVTHTWTVSSPPTNTRAGIDVTVPLPVPGDPRNATVNFAQVDVAGVTTLDIYAGGPTVPSGYGGARYFDVHTTADWTEPATVCVPYDPAEFVGTAARLLHYDGAVWIDVTVTNDPAVGRVCGQPESFSLFALVGGTGVFPLASIIAGPTNPASTGTATFTFAADQPDAPLQCSLDGLPFENCESPKTYTQLEEGSHTFAVQALGQTGTVNPTLVPPVYEWEIVLQPDVTDPDTRITAGPGQLTGNYINTFEFTGTDDQTPDLDLEFECLLDGVLLGSCSSPEEVEVLAAGQHTFSVRAIDETGNVDQSPATRTFTVIDVTAPDTSIELGPESETEASVAIFEFIGEEPDGTPVNEFECALDGADFVDCPTPYTVENISVGPHYLEVRAKDIAGVVDSTPDIYEWLRVSPNDTTAPDTFIVSTPGPVSGPDTIFGFQASEPVSEFQCQVDGGPWEGCEAAFELVGLTSGQHTLRVRAVDAAVNPNVDPTPASFTWNVVGEPETTIDSGPEAVSGARNATFTFSSDQSDATFRCSFNGSIPIPCTSPYVAGPFIQDSEYTFEVQAENGYRYLDGERVADQSPAEWQWVVQDTEPPTTELLSVTHLGPADLVEPDSLRFEITGTDNGTVWFELGFECSLDGGPWEGCDQPYHYLSLLELPGGQHELRIRAIDDFDNVDPTPVVHTFTTEAGPETSVLTGPDPETASTSATFSFATEGPAGTTFQCSLDLGLFADCTNPVTFTDVPYGEHELLVRSKGPGGAVDLSPAEYSWASGDMTPPVVSILTGPPIATTETTAMFTLTVDDPAASLQCSLDGAPPTYCDPTTTYTDLVAGPHILEVSAIAPNLLVDPVPAVWEWTVEDQAAPETTLAATPPAEIGLGTLAAFRFTSNELDATFECSLNGEPFAACAGAAPDNTAEFGSLEAGTHVLRVRAVDPSLNADETPATFTLTVVGPATTTIVGGPPADATTTDRLAAFGFTADQPSVTFACSLDGADYADCSEGASYADLSYGGHTLDVASTNRFGLLEEPPVSRTWIVAPPGGIIPPETTLTAVPTDPSTETTATFGFTADQAATFACSVDGGAFAPCASGVTFTGLTEGVHTVAVRATNTFFVSEDVAASYSWTIDLAPVTQIDSGPPANTLISDAVFNFSANEPATFECALDGDSFGSCDASHTVPAVPVGSHTLQVRAVDANGNVDATPESYTWTVEAPVDTTLVSSVESPTDSTSATFTLTSNKPGASFECALDLAADVPTFTPCSSPVTYTGLGFGEHVLLARAVDGLGRRDLTPAEFEWEVGGQPPLVSLHSAPPVTDASRSASFVFSAPGFGLDFECALDSGTWSPCLSPKTYTGLPYGPHTFSVRVLSPNATTEPPITTHEWTVVKLSVPETTLDLRPPAVTGPGSSEAPIGFTFSSNEATATFECALNGEVFSPCDTPMTYEGLVPGEYNFRVRAVDVAGNRDLSPEVYRWTVAPAPETVIDSGPEPDLISGANVRFEFSSDFSEASFECTFETETGPGVFTACNTPHLLTGLADGEYTLLVRAVSAQGIADETPADWTWTVGLVPQTTIESGPADPTTSTSASFRFSASEADVTYECALDGSAFAQCEEFSDFVHHVVTGLGLGGHTLQVRAVDTVGNVDESPASYTWTVIAPPNTTIVTGPASEDPASTAEFTFSSDNPTATFECSLDLGTWAACTSPKQLNNLALGYHTLSVRAVDNLGNPDLSPASYSWTVVEPRETEPPDTTLVQTPPASTPNTTAVFRLESSELGSTFECSLDGGAFAPCAARVEYADLALTSHTFQARATDAAGNVDETPASYVWTVTGGDVTAPDTTIDSGPPASSPSSSATFTFSADEAGATFECSLSGAAYEACTSPKTYTDLPVGGELAGEHTLHVRAVDAAGNKDGSPALWEWTVLDVTAPQTTISEKPEDPSATGAASFTFEGTDNGTAAIDLGFECQLDSEPAATCESPFTRTGLSPGLHTFTVAAEDEAGNVDATPASWTWRVLPAPDVTPPSITLDGPETGTTDTSARFTFGADEPVTGFECSLDGGLFAACASPYDATGLAVGEHSFSVRATDLEGNTTTRSHAWETVAPPDTTDPVTTFQDVPPAQTASRTATLRFAADEQASFKCRLDGAPNGSFNTCASPVELTDLTVGEHTFEVVATDAAGNEAAPVSRTWTVMAPPTTTIDVSAAGTPVDPTDSRSATFTFASNQTGSTFECALDTEDVYEPCTSPQSYSDLADGAHDFSVRATGPAGNTGQSDTFGWDIGDITPPVITISGGPGGTESGGSTEATSAEFTFSSDDPAATLFCSLDGAPAVSCTSPKPYSETQLARATGSALGEHTLEVTADKQGLLVPAEPVTWTWAVVDETAPETTIGTVPARIGLGATDAATLSSNEAGVIFECSLDGEPFTNCATPYELDHGVGDHTLEVRAVDGSGNADGTPATTSWSVVGEPVTTLTGSAEGSTATFTFTADQFGVAFECSLDSAVLDACTSPFSASGLADGPHTLVVRATNEFGLVGSTVSETVTTTAPPTGNTQPGTDVVVTTGSATLTFANVTSAGNTSIDSLAGAPALPVGFVTDGAAFYDVTTTAAFTGNVEVCVSYDPGSITQPVRLLHHDGTAWQDVTTSNNETTGVVCGETTSLSPFAVAGQVVLPETTIHDKPAALTASPTASFTFSSDDPAATFQCSLDAADAWTSCQAAETFESLATGEHTLLVRAQVGVRVDATPASHTWTVEEPDTTVVSGPQGTTVSTSATFEFSSTDPLAEFECALDGAASYGSCQSPYTLTVGVGAHELLVRAKNAAGTVDPTPASYSWTVGALPDTTITSSPQDPTDSRTATFEFASSEPGSTFECAINEAAAAGTFETCVSGKTYSDLTYESHTFLVRAVDAQGNVDPTPAEFEWEIGEIPPAASIDSGPTGSTESRAATFAFSTTGSGWTFECQRDGGAWSPCTSPKTYDGLPLGTHTFSVRVFSPEAVVEVEPATRTWTVADLTAPETTIDFGPTSPTNATTADFGFSSTEQNATFECSLDGAGFAACPEPSEYTGLTVGDHTLQVRAVDASGNADTSPASYTWRVAGDTTAPETAIGSKPAARTEAVDATFSFSTNEPGSTFECRIDAEPFAECTAPAEYSDLGLGSHTFEVRGTDQLGNVDPSPASYAWEVVADATEPETTLTSTPPASTLETTARFGFSSNEPLATFECSLDNATFEECSTPEALELAPGEHTFAVRAVDESLNVDQTPATYAWTVLADTTAPQTTIDSGPAAETTSRVATFAFSASEAGSTFECSVDGNGFSECLTPYQLTDVEPGAHTLAVRAVDAAGNVDGSPAESGWTVVVPPETTIDSAPESGESRSATFEFSSDQPGSTFECRLDGAGQFTACTSPKVYTGLAEVEHTFEARAVRNGVTDETPALHEWAVEPATVPVTTIDSAPESGTTGRSATFTFSADEAGSTFECRLDEAAYTACTSPVELTGLALGEHAFRVRATDADGNVEQSGASHVWTIGEEPDTTAPDTTITDGPTGSDGLPNGTVTFTGTDDRTGDLQFECKLDGGAWQTCTSPYAYADLVPGSHTIQVRATDAAGNVDGTAAARTWTVAEPRDAQAPETTVNSGPTDPTTSRTASVTFSGTDNRTAPNALTFECRLDAGAWVGCTSAAAYQNLTDGLHTVRVRAVDQAGNVDASPAFHQWYVRTAQAANCGPQLTLAANADAWIDQKSPSQNKGTDSILKVQGKSGSNNFRALVRFPLPAVSADCVVQSAKLRIYNASPKNGRTIQALRATASWTEGGVTWGNQPATATPAATVTTTNNAGFNEWTVTGQVQAMLAPNANHGFLIRDAAENSGSFEQQYHAREKGQNVPQLIVSFVPAPPDTVVPDTSITAGPGVTTAATNASFASASSELGAVFECALDGGAFVACGPAASYTGLTSGAHRFAVRSRDPSGNVDPTPAVYEWTITGG